jgi:hypothetical protein
MERLLKDPQGYVKSILEFCRCPGRIERLSEARRVGLSAAALTVCRGLNPWIRRNPSIPWPATRAQRAVIKLCKVINRVTPKSWSAPVERRWKETAARRYAGAFRNSNRRLAELTGIDLAAWDYEL